MLSEEITVNHTVKCSNCRNSWVINVDGFKRKRDDFGRGKPLLWIRLVCSKCRSRAFTIFRTLPYDYLSPEEREAQARFDANMARWNSPVSFDDYYDNEYVSYLSGDD